MTSYTINSRFLAKNIENWISYGKMKKKKKKKTENRPFFSIIFLSINKRMILVTIYVYNRRFEIYSKKFSK